MIRIDAAWFAIEPLDMRAGVDKALARVVIVFGEARAHHAYLFVNKRSTRMKVLVHDGFRGGPTSLFAILLRAKSRSLGRHRFFRDRVAPTAACVFHRFLSATAPTYPRR